MIYQSYNFIDSYSNASGNRKNSMVLGELGKCISREPKAIINALQDAGVNVPRNPSKRDLVRLILANRQNRALVQSLSVLITANATATDSYDNLIDDRYDNLLSTENTANRPLTQAEAEAEAKKNPPIPYASPNASPNASSTEKVGLLQKVGNWFQKRKADKQLDPTKAGTAEQESAFRRFTNWFTKNRDTIGQVYNTLNNSLGSANQNNIPTGDGGGDGGDGGDGGGGAEQTWIQKNKTIVLVGLLAVGVYFFYKGKVKGKK
jgi:hypothetical protein